MASARLTLALAVALFAGISCAQPSGRILGGDFAPSGEYPYAASVRLDGAHICGGSIVSATHIITAAHCVANDGRRAINADRLSVRVGSTNQFAGGSIVYIAAITTNPDYKELGHDVAILTLATALKWSAKIASIALATAEDEEPPLDAAVTVAGWGEQTGGEAPYKLRVAELSVASEDACKNAFSGHDASTICLAHPLKEGSCNGDAGNGAVYNNRLVAVSNYVIGACGSRYPDVFANVAYYAKWIESVIGSGEQ